MQDNFSGKMLGKALILGVTDRRIFSQTRRGHIFTNVTWKLAKIIILNMKTVVKIEKQLH